MLAADLIRRAARTLSILGRDLLKTQPEKKVALTEQEKECRLKEVIA